MLLKRPVERCSRRGLSTPLQLSHLPERKQRACYEFWRGTQEEVGAADDELPSLAQDDVGDRALECLPRDMDGAHTLRPGDRRLVVARRRRLAAADHALGTHRAITQTRPIRPPLRLPTQHSATTGNEQRPPEECQAGQHRSSSSSERSSPGLGNRGRRNRRTTPS